MRAVSTDLAADIAKECTTLCRIWTVTRLDGTILRFTDADQSVTFGAHVYRSDISFSSSAIQMSSNNATAQQVTITVVMDDDGINETDLRQGRYKGARGVIEILNYEAPTHGSMVLYSGTFGDTELSDKRRATIDLQPLSFGANQAITMEMYSFSCRAILGDARCTVDLDALKVAFTVTAVAGSSFTAAELIAADHYFAQGSIVWATGNNAGIAAQVADNDAGLTKATLIVSPIKPIVIGDTGFIYPGCDKQPTTCRDKFSNMVNYRGEPFVPTPLIAQTPSAQNPFGSLMYAAG